MVAAVNTIDRPKSVRNRCVIERFGGVFIRPSSDGTFYEKVMSVRPGLRPSDSLSACPGLCPTVFHIFLLHALTYWAEMFFGFLLFPFWNLEYRKCAVFRTFLLHALTYWAEILHVTLFYRNTDHVGVSSMLEYWEYTVLRIFLLHALTYWTENLHMTVFHCKTEQVVNLRRLL